MHWSLHCEQSDAMISLCSFQQFLRIHNITLLKRDSDWKMFSYFTLFVFIHIYKRKTLFVNNAFIRACLTFTSWGVEKWSCAPTAHIFLQDISIFELLDHTRTWLSFTLQSVKTHYKERKSICLNDKLKITMTSTNQEQPNNKIATCFDKGCMYFSNLSYFSFSLSKARLQKMKSIIRGTSNCPLFCYTKANVLTALM